MREKTRKREKEVEKEGDNLAAYLPAAKLLAFYT